MHLLPANLAGVTQNLPWFGPLAIGLLVRAWLDRNHRRKFTGAGRRVIVTPASGGRMA